jgi:hypothetical protein
MCITRLPDADQATPQVRSGPSGDPEAVLESIRAEIASIEPLVPVAEVRLMDEFVRDAMARGLLQYQPSHCGATPIASARCQDGANRDSRAAADRSVPRPSRPGSDEVTADRDGRQVRQLARDYSVDCEADATRRTAVESVYHHRTRGSRRLG